MLEQFAYSYIDQVEPGWVINTMRSVGVPYEMLFEAYLVIFDAKVCKHVLRLRSSYSTNISIDYSDRHGVASTK
jgi:hypothetical protein